MSQYISETQTPQPSLIFTTFYSQFISSKFRKMKRVKRTKTDRRSSLAGAGTPNSESNQEWRDWTALPSDIVLTFADMLLSDDVTHYVRFRGICTTWRKNTRDPSSNPADLAFRPKNWIPVKCDGLTKPPRPEFKDGSCFLNIRTGKYVWVNILELNSGFRTLFTLNACLLLLNQMTGDIFLLNPFTRSFVADLPPLKSLMNVTNIKSYSNIKRFFSNVIFLPSSCIVLFFSEINEVVYAKPGKQHWVALRTDVWYFSTLFFKGSLYVVTRAGELLQLAPKYNSVVKPFIMKWVRQYLVECDGQMFVVWHCVDLFKRSEPYVEIYKLDLDKMRLVRTCIPFGYALVISESAARCVAVSTHIFPCMQLDSIYFDFTCLGSMRHLISIYGSKSKLDPARIEYRLSEELLYTNKKTITNRCKYPSEQHFLVDNFMAYLENAAMR